MDFSPNNQYQIKLISDKQKKELHQNSYFDTAPFYYRKDNYICLTLSIHFKLQHPSFQQPNACSYANAI